QLRNPAQESAGFRRVEFQISVFVRMATGIVMPFHVRTPAGVKVVGYPRNCFLAGFKGTEVPAAAKRQTILVKMLCYTEVAMDRLQHVLPGPDRMGTPNLNRPVRDQGVEDIRYETVPGPIAAADDVASSRGGKREAVLLVLVRVEERLPIGGEYE